MSEEIGTHLTKLESLLVEDLTAFALLLIIGTMMVNILVNQYCISIKRVRQFRVYPYEF